MNSNQLQALLQESVELAVAGNLTDTNRVTLYRLALNIACEELYRMEETGRGSVDPACMLLIQQLGALCEDSVDPAKLYGPLLGKEPLIEVATPKIELVRS